MAGGIEIDPQIKKLPKFSFKYQKACKETQGENIKILEAFGFKKDDAVILLLCKDNREHPRCARQLYRMLQPENFQTTRDGKPAKMNRPQFLKSIGLSF